MGWRLVFTAFFCINSMWTCFEVKNEKNLFLYESKTEQKINEDNQEDDYIKKIYEELGMEELDLSFRNIVPEVNINLESIMEAAYKGDISYVMKNIGMVIAKTFVGDLEENKNLMVSLIIIVLLGSVFVNMSNSFGKGFISENGFYVTYLIMTSILLAAFMVAFDMFGNAIQRILFLIRTLVPFFSASIVFLGKTSTAFGMYQVILICIWIVEAIMVRVILPLIKFYVIISMINNLNQEDSFSKMCVLIKKIVQWLLKTVVMFVLGINVIKSLLEPQMDILGRNSIKKVMSLLPGGGSLNVLTSTFLGAGIIIKNTVGVAGILFIAIVCLMPIIKAFLMILTVRLTNAMIQPIGDKRYGNGMEALSNGVSLLMETLLSASVLFVLTIAVMAYATNQIS